MILSVQVWKVTWIFFPKVVLLGLLSYLLSYNNWLVVDLRLLLLLLHHWLVDRSWGIIWLHRCRLGLLKSLEGRWRHRIMNPLQVRKTSNNTSIVVVNNDVINCSRLHMNGLLKGLLSLLKLLRSCNIWDLRNVLRSRSLSSQPQWGTITHFLATSCWRWTAWWRL